MLWFQPGGGYAALYPVETKGQGVALGGKDNIDKAPVGDLNGRRPRNQKG